MKERKCNLCKEHIPGSEGVSFGDFDLCAVCVPITRTAVCLKCKGIGKIREADREASFAQASCGESRTEYRTVKCPACKGQ